MKLPYRGSNVSAIALLPNRAAFGLDADKALAQLDLSKLLSASSWQPSSKASPSLVVSLPRFNVSVSMLSLEPVSRAGAECRASSSQPACRPLVFECLSGATGAAHRSARTGAALPHTVCHMLQSI